MPKLTIQALGRRLVEKRGGKGVRETAKEIGISSATLSRVERGHHPDLETFKKICKWLEVDPGEVFGFSSSPSSSQTAPTVAVHFKKDRSLEPETAQALAQMILAAQRAWLVSGGGKK